MLPSRNLRLVDAVSRCERGQFARRSGAYRQFSINASTSHAPRVTRILPASRLRNVQPSRSLSLFGWGSSSTPTPDQSVGPSAANVDIGPTAPGLDNVRAVKASLATSDVPDPSRTHSHLPNPLEPQVIEDLQEKLIQPHGTASDRIAEIAGGDVDISAAAERMGYLKEVCGLDFGWGPTSVMEYLLEWLHVNGGLSWTASIVVIGALIRLAMVKPTVDAQIQSKKMREIRPYTLPLRQKYLQLMQSGQQSEAVQVGAELKEMTKAANISYSKAFIPLLIQLPFSFGAFRILRNAGQLPVPAFVTENWLWTTDLSFSDPYYIVPAISGFAIYLTFKLQSAGANTMFGPQMMKIFGIGLPISSFIFMSFQPGAVQLYFMTTGIGALLQASLLRQMWFRRWANLGPLPESEPAAPAPGASPGASQSRSTSTKLPSNIQRIVPTNVSKPVEATLQPEENRSAIDKVVDNVKGGWKSLSTSASGSSTLAQTKKEQEDRRKKAAADRYQATRQMQLDQERQLRNQQARDRMR